MTNKSGQKVEQTVGKDDGGKTPSEDPLEGESEVPDNVRFYRYLTEFDAAQSVILR